MFASDSPDAWVNEAVSNGATNSSSSKLKKLKAPEKIGAPDSSTSGDNEPQKITNRTTDGKTKSHLNKKQKYEIDKLINAATDKYSFNIYENLEGAGGLVESLDVGLIRISKEYDIEIGFHIYEVEGGGYFATEIYTDYLSGRIKSSDSFLIPSLDGQLAGGYHTHGGEVYSLTDYFSGRSGDFGYASKKVVYSGNYNYKFYLSSPSGILKSFDAGRYQSAGIKAERNKFGSGAKLDPRQFVRTLR